MEIGGVKAMATIALWYLLCGTLVEEGVHFLLEEVVWGGVQRVTMGRVVRRERKNFIR